MNKKKNHEKNIATFSESVGIVYIKCALFLENGPPFDRKRSASLNLQFL